MGGRLSCSNSLKDLKHSRGFTIVELLIVIVVIGILAAISVVAYNGIQDRARDTARDIALSNGVRVLESYKALSDGSFNSLITEETGWWATTCLGSVEDYPETSVFPEGVCSMIQPPGGDPQPWSAVDDSVSSKLASSISAPPDGSFQDYEFSTGGIRYFNRGVSMDVVYYQDGSVAHDYARLYFYIDESAQSSCPSGSIGEEDGVRFCEIYVYGSGHQNY